MNPKALKYEVFGASGRPRKEQSYVEHFVKKAVALCRVLDRDAILLRVQNQVVRSEFPTLPYSKFTCRLAKLSCNCRAANQIVAEAM